jgi:hypothetical protein
MRLLWGKSNLLLLLNVLPSLRQRWNIMDKNRSKSKCNLLNIIAHCIIGNLLCFVGLSFWRGILHYAHKYGSIQATNKMKCNKHT